MPPTNEQLKKTISSISTTGLKLLQRWITDELTARENLTRITKVKKRKDGR